MTAVVMRSLLDHTGHGNCPFDGSAGVRGMAQALSRWADAYGPPAALVSHPSGRSIRAERAKSLNGYVR
jgi:hypothetical protein